MRFCKYVYYPVIFLMSLSSSEINAQNLVNPYNNFSDFIQDLQQNVGYLNLRYIEQFYGQPKYINSDNSVTLEIEHCPVTFTYKNSAAITAFSVPTIQACSFDLVGSQHRFTEKFTELTLRDILKAYPVSSLASDTRTAYFDTPCYNCGNAFEPYTVYHYSAPHVMNFIQMEFTFSQPDYSVFWDNEENVTRQELAGYVLKNGLNEAVSQIKVGYDLFELKDVK